MSEIIAADLQDLEVTSGIVDLYQLVLEETSDGVPSLSLYFHSGKNETLSDITFRDYFSPYTLQTYTALPVDMSGIELKSEGAVNRPVITMANVLTTFSDAIVSGSATYNRSIDLLGKTIIHRQTLEKHLTSGSNSVAPIEFSKRVYTIDRVTEETNLLISFELAQAHDLEGLILPKRRVYGKYCSWTYRGYYGVNYPYELDSSGNEVAVSGGTAKKQLQGGCTWRPAFAQYEPTAITPASASTILTPRNIQREFRPYFTTEDIPLIPENYVTGANKFGTTGVTYRGQDYDSTITYDQSSYVKHTDGNYYLSKIDSNTGVAPVSGGPGDTRWQLVHTYKRWHRVSNSDTITIGDRYEHAYTVWQCQKTFTATITNAEHIPNDLSRFWTRIEGCGKTLESCKKRFHATMAHPSTNERFTYTYLDDGTNGRGDSYNTTQGQYYSITPATGNSSTDGTAAISFKQKDIANLPFGGYPTMNQYN